MHDYAPNVIQAGQKSGGGGGLPMAHLLDENKNHIEPDIEPDEEAVIVDYATTNKDGIVERAIEEMLTKLQSKRPEIFPASYYYSTFHVLVPTVLSGTNSMPCSFILEKVTV